MKWRIASTLALALALPGLAAAVAVPSTPEQEKPRNLLVVTIDTWRWDYLSAIDRSKVKTPALDALAAEGMLFSNTRVAAPVTLVSHASLFTGLDPTAHGVHHNGVFALHPDHQTLAEVLRERGFQTAAVTGAYVVSSRYGLDQGFDSYLDVLSHDLYSDVGLSAAYPALTAAEVTDRALRQIGKFSFDRPWFLWVHYFDPHGEYRAPEPHASRYRGDPYAAEVAYVDAQLSRLVERLAQQDLWSRTAVLVTSDHGESLGEHGELNHGHFVFDATIRVSSLLKGPSVPAGTRSDTPVRSIDLMPTLLELLGVAGARDLQGRSLAAAWGGEPVDFEPAYSETFLPYYDYGWGYLRSLVMEGWKYIRGPEPRLFDLAADPGETRNLAAVEPERLARMDRELSRRVASTSGDAVAHVELSESERQSLISLGYLGGSSGAPVETSDEGLSELPDPHEMIHLERVIWDAWAAHGRGEPERALKLLDRVLDENPQNSSALRFAAAISRQQGDWERSLRYLEQMADQWPSEAWRYQHARAEHDWRQGRRRQAEKGLRALVEGCAPDESAPAERCLEPLSLLVNLTLEQGDRSGAARALDRSGSTSWSTLSTEDRLRLADLHLKAGLVEPAEEMLLALTREADSVPDVYFSLGNLFQTTGREARAIASFERAIRLDPGFVPAKINLASIYGVRGRLDLANRLLYDVLERDPKNSRAMGNLGLNLYFQGRIREAIRMLEEAAQLDPSGVRVRLNLAQVYLQQQEVKRALAICRKVIELEPDNVQARELLRRHG